MYKAWMLVIFIFVSMTVFASIQRSNVISKNFSSLTILPSKKEVKNARILIEAIAALKNDKVSNGWIKKLKYPEEGNLFYEVADEILAIKNLEKTAKSKSIVLKNCSEKKILPTDSYLSKRIKKGINNYCHRKFLKNLTMAKPYMILRKKNIHYLKRALPYLLKYRLKKGFNKYLLKIRKSKKVKRIVYRLISNVIIQNNIDIPSNTLNIIKINEKLQKHIDRKIIRNGDSSKYFISNFKKLEKKLIKTLNRNKWSEAKEFLDQLVSYYADNKEYIDKDYAWKVFARTGKKLFLNYGLNNEAVNLFKYMIKMAPENKMDNTLFLVIWSNFLTGNVTRNTEIIEKMKIFDRIEKVESRLIFWMAYSYEATNKKEKAAKLFKLLAEKGSLDFYSIIALKKLLETNKLKINDSEYRKVATRRQIGKISNKYISTTVLNGFKKLMLWITFGENSLVGKEIKHLISLGKKKVFIKFEKINLWNKIDLNRFMIDQITSVLNSRNLFLWNFKLIYRYLGRGVLTTHDKIVKRLFPLEYLEEIKKLKPGIDPLIILSLIRQESAFNPSALSRAGARGLMQIMPTTAKQIAKKRIRNKKLQNPKLNLKLGVKYLKKLLKNNEGNLIYALAAYNAGENALRRWKERYFHTENPLVTIESIPYKETRNYVKLIYRNIFFYKLLSFKSEIKNKVNDSFFVKLNY